MVLSRLILQLHIAESFLGHGVFIWSSLSLLHVYEDYIHVVCVVLLYAAHCVCSWADIATTLSTATSRATPTLIWLEYLICPFSVGNVYSTRTTLFVTWHLSVVVGVCSAIAAELDISNDRETGICLYQLERSRDDVSSLLHSTNLCIPSHIQIALSACLHVMKGVRVDWTTICRMPDTLKTTAWTAFQERTLTEDVDVFQATIAN